ncbi:MAG: hypothetical protein J0H73_11845 [Salana multivorans]|nr:hypothetical protein [Salana multivorans]
MLIADAEHIAGLDPQTARALLDHIDGLTMALSMESQIRGDGLAADLATAVTRADRAEAEVERLRDLDESCQRVHGDPGPCEHDSRTGDVCDTCGDGALAIIDRLMEDKADAEQERDEAYRALDRVRDLLDEWAVDSPASGPFPDRVALDVDIEIIAPLRCALDPPPTT